MSSTLRDAAYSKPIAFSSILNNMNQAKYDYLQKHPEIKLIFHQLIMACLKEQPSEISPCLPRYMEQITAAYNRPSNIYQSASSQNEEQNLKVTPCKQNDDIETNECSYKKIPYLLTVDMSKTRQYPSLVISGCSGVGKNTLVTHLQDKYPNRFILSVSYTTRKPRDGQKDGYDYFFVDKKKFEDEIQEDQNAFVEHGYVHGNYYGTKRDQVEKIRKEGKICLLDVDLVAGEKIYNQMPESIFIFIHPPEPYFETLEQRMRARGKDSEETIQKRLKNARGEKEKVQKLEFYQQFVNQQRQSFFNEVEEYINEKCESQNN